MLNFQQNEVFMKKHFKILRQCLLFDGINDENLLPMLNCLGAEQKKYDKNQIIFAEGSIAERFGILLSGEAQIVRVDYYGNRSLVGRVGRGELFGEAFACAEVKNLPVDVIATEDCEVLLVDVKRVTQTCCNACEFHNRIIYNLMKIVAAKNLSFHRKLEIISGRTTRDKLMNYLLFLTIRKGEIHAVMGPNGAGKSTLSAVLAGKPQFTVTAGTIEFMGQDLLAMSPEERAWAGIFLSFQYPVEIPGVTITNFMKTAVNAHRAGKGLEPLKAGDFLKLMREKMAFVQMKPEFAKREVNVGFSGGEKKRNEIFQMAMLDPTLAILDETDSGLDVDALRIVANGVNALHTPEKAAIVITHYQRLLDYIVPDVVHVLKDGRIVKTAGKELVAEIEEKGYDNL